MDRRGVTLIEAIVAVAILVTLVAMLWPAISAATAAAGRKPRPDGPPATVHMVTVQHDEHWWVMCRDMFAHHPDCPCRRRRAEEE